MNEKRYYFVAPTHEDGEQTVADLDDGKVSTRIEDAISRMTGDAAKSEWYVVWNLADRPNGIEAVRHASSTPFDNLVRRDEKRPLVILSRIFSRKIGTDVVTHTEAVL